MIIATVHLSYVYTCHMCTLATCFFSTVVTGYQYTSCNLTCVLHVALLWDMGVEVLWDNVMWCVPDHLVCACLKVICVGICMQQLAKTILLHDNVLCML